MLSPYRVLDLTDEKGFLCAKILGDLGADVIKIEQPGGDPSRGIGPFYHDIPHSERSLYWFAYNTNKRGITLNIKTPQGKEILKQLVKRAHFIVESFTPGYLDNLKLGYKALNEINPQIILTSITPFGQTGPHSKYKASDIVTVAASGLMYLCGDPDRPPVHTSFPQSYLHAGAEAAAGTMIAHYYRELSGEGQWVDVSIQESTLGATMNAPSFWDLNQVILERAGPFRVGLSSQARQRLIWECRDGYVAFAIFGGAFGAPTNRALVKWMDSEGMASQDLLMMDWESFDMATATQQQFDHFAQPISKFFLLHSKRELYHGAIDRGIMLCPVATIEDIVDDPQLRARDFWEEVEHAEVGTAITYPGAFIKPSDMCVKIRRRAPMVGEHNEEIYGGELGLSEQELAHLRQDRVI